jgi:sugar lactone lactonase YvrE
VSGGAGGTGRVIDSHNGHILAEYQFAPPPATFINDVVLTRRAAYFTDSLQPQLYVVPLGGRGQLPAQAAVRSLRLSGDWVQQAGFNANGIERTPDGKALLVVQSNTGFLFRVDPATGVADRVELGGKLVLGGDGLLLRGRTLYVVQGAQNQVAVVRLNRSGRRGTVTSHPLTSTDFDFPTTVAAFGGGLYLPNARFNTPPQADTKYWVTRVELGHDNHDHD